MISRTATLARRGAVHAPPEDIPGCAAYPASGSRRVPGKMSRMTTPGPNTTDATQDWLSVGDAAKEVGVAAQTIRNWISAGSLQTRTGRGPRGSRVEVNIDDVRKLTSDRARSVPTAEGEPAQPAGPPRRRTAAQPKAVAAAGTATTPGRRSRAASQAGSASPPVSPNPEPQEFAAPQPAIEAPAALESPPAAPAGTAAAFPGGAGPSIEELQQVLAGLVSRIEALEGAVTGLQQHRAGVVRRGFFRRL